MKILLEQQNMVLVLRERGYFWNACIDLEETSFAPDSAVYGLLEIEDDGSIRLELDGLIDGASSIDWSGVNFSKPKNIAGKLKSDGSSVLLVEAFSNGQSYSTHNIAHEKFVAHYCLAAPCEVEALKLDFQNIVSVKSYCEAYNEMFGLEPIAFKNDDCHISVSYERPKPTEVRLDNKTIIIDHDITVPFGDERMLDSLNIKCSTTFEIKFDIAISLDIAASEHRKMQDLFILLSDIRSYLEWPKILSNTSDNVSTLYYIRGRPGTDIFERHRCWVSIPQISATLPFIIRSWFEKRETIGAGINLYLSTRRGMEMYSEQRFMSLMWGLEAFHRAITPPTDLSKIEAKIDRILSAVQNRDRHWLKNRLSGSFEPGLDTRIFDLFKSLPLNISTEQLTTLSQLCRSIRNNVSHFGEIGRKDELISHAKLADLFRAVSYLYHARILLEIGISENHIRWIFIESFNQSLIRRSLEISGVTIN